MTTFINSESDFVAWDGLTPAELQQDITITSVIDSHIINADFNGNGFKIIFDVNDHVNPLFIPYSSTPSDFTVSNLTIQINAGTIWACLISQTFYQNISFYAVEIINNSFGLTIGPFMASSYQGISNTYTTSFINCKYHGDISDNCAGFGGNNVGSPNGQITLQGCYVSCPSIKGGYGYFGANCKIKSIDQCVFQGITDNSGIFQSNLTGFVAYSTVVETFTNCYCLIGSNTTIAAIPPFISRYTSGSIPSFPYTFINISNCYYIKSPYSTYSSTGFLSSSYSGSGLQVTLNGIASSVPILASDSQTIDLVSSNNNITDYSLFSSTSDPPFDSWDTSIWDLNQNPPLLKIFKSAPWHNYTSYDNVPYLYQSTSVPCLCKGTKVLTISGYKPVEDIKVGEQLIRKDGKNTRVEKIYYEKLLGRGNTLPYLIKKDSFGENIPFEDIYLSPQHAFFADNEWHHPKCCREKYSLRQSKLNEEVEYYHIRTTDYFEDVIFAAGLPVETHADSKDAFSIWNCSKEKCSLTK